MKWFKENWLILLIAILFIALTGYLSYRYGKSQTVPAVITSPIEYVTPINSTITQVPISKEQMQAIYDSLANVLKIKPSTIKEVTNTVVIVDTFIKIVEPVRYKDSILVEYKDKDLYNKAVVYTDTLSKSYLYLEITPDTATTITTYNKRLFSSDEYKVIFNHTNSLFNTSKANSVTIKVPKEYIVISVGPSYDVFNNNLGISITAGVPIFRIRW